MLQEEQRVNVELTSSCQYRLSSSVLQEEQRVTFKLISSCQYRLSSSVLQKEQTVNFELYIVSHHTSMLKI